MARPKILTQAALARVASLVNQGHSAAEIANQIGCTLGTLRVRCSQSGISLRRRARVGRKRVATAMNQVASTETSAAPRCRSLDQVYATKQSRTVVTEPSAAVRIELKILLPQITAEQLQQRGALRGISGSTFASKLIMTIARDGLYDAVIDAG